MEKIALLKKVRALAERGAPGEREAASDMLERLLDKYGISERDLDEERREVYEFRFRGPEERRLLLQICFMVTNRTDNLYSYRRARKLTASVGIECTEAERVEIELTFDFYRELWERERAAFLTAFINKHDLFGDPENHTAAPPRELSPEELEKMLSYMKGMSDESPRKMIEGASA